MNVYEVFFGICLYMFINNWVYNSNENGEANVMDKTPNKLFKHLMDQTEPWRQRL
jgi:hypothetical protein